MSAGYQNPSDLFLDYSFKTVFGKGLFLHLYLTGKSAGHLIATVIESAGACLEKKKEKGKCHSLCTYNSGFPCFV